VLSGAIKKLYLRYTVANRGSNSPRIHFDPPSTSGFPKVTQPDHNKAQEFIEQCLFYSGWRSLSRKFLVFFFLIQVQSGPLNFALVHDTKAHCPSPLCETIAIYEGHTNVTFATHIPPATSGHEVVSYSI
jgi:hypothetical protein